MKNVFEQNNGITLIALIITIIVMLILVAVTISMAINGGLFGYAGNATRDTKNAIDEEKEWANIQNAATIDDLISKYSPTQPSFRLPNNYEDYDTFYFDEGTTWAQWIPSNSDFRTTTYGTSSSVPVIIQRKNYCRVPILANSNNERRNLCSG